MGVGLIHAVRAAVLADHCLEHARTEQPLVQFHPAFAERIFKTLLRPCSETVKRDRKACNAHFRHDKLPFISTIYLIAGNVSEMGHLTAGRHRVAARSRCVLYQPTRPDRGIVGALPTMYAVLEFAEVGGLVSYGPDLTNAYREAGNYTGRILNCVQTDCSLWPTS